MRIWTVDCPQSETKRQRGERILLDLLEEGELGRDLRYVEKLRKRRNGHNSDALENVFAFMNLGLHNQQDNTLTRMRLGWPFFGRFPHHCAKPHPDYCPHCGWKINIARTPLPPIFNAATPCSICGNQSAGSMLDGAFGSPALECLAGSNCPWQRLLRPPRNCFGPLNNLIRDVDLGNHVGPFGLGNRDMEELVQRRGWQEAREREEQRRQQLRDDQEELEARRLIDSNWRLFRGNNGQLLNLLAGQRNNGMGGLPTGFGGQYGEQRRSTIPRAPWVHEGEEVAPGREGLPRRQRAHYEPSSWEDRFGMDFGRHAGYKRHRRHGKLGRGAHKFDRDENSVLDGFGDSDDLGISEESESPSPPHWQRRSAPNKMRRQRHGHGVRPHFDERPYMPESFGLGAFARPKRGPKRSGDAATHEARQGSSNGGEGTA